MYMLKRIPHNWLKSDGAGTWEGIILRMLKAKLLYHYTIGRHVGRDHPEADRLVTLSLAFSAQVPYAQIPLLQPAEGTSYKLAPVGC